MNKYSFTNKYTGNNHSHGATRHYYRLNFHNEADEHFVQRLIARIFMRPHISEVRNHLEEHFVYRSSGNNSYQVTIVQPDPPKAKQFNYSDEDDDDN